MRVTDGPHACFHASDACYPTMTTGSMYGTIGGIPGYSNSKNMPFISLEDFPPHWHLYRDDDDTYCVQSPDEKVYRGETAVHALSVAYVGSKQGPKITDMWEEGWKGYAVTLGIIESEDDPLPDLWEPPLVIRVHRYKMFFDYLMRYPGGGVREHYASAQLQSEIDILLAAGIDEEWLKAVADPSLVPKQVTEKPRSWLGKLRR